jgi:mono/diheme cytochrome c family protein
MKIIYKLVALVGVAVLVVSCKDDLKPNYQYMPNMYEYIGYSTYSASDAFKGGVEAQLPAEGSIKRGFEVYNYENSPEGYNAAKLNSKSPLAPVTAEEKEKVKYLFEVYCAICHGNEGNGKGKLVTQGKILGVPSYKDREITEGSVYHVMQYGINSMGAYSNQLSQKERWMVASYVMELKSKL